MFVVFKMHHYIDEPECEILAVFKSKSNAKQYADKLGAKFQYVPFFQ